METVQWVEISDFDTQILRLRLGMFCIQLPANADVCDHDRPADGQVHCI